MADEEIYTTYLIKRRKKEANKWEKVIIVLIYIQKEYSNIFVKETIMIVDALCI